MADTISPKAPRMRQARKSIAHLPSSMGTPGDKENATMDGSTFSAIGARSKSTSKKSRSKSLGPGGLDALMEGNGNRGRPSLPQIKSILKPTTPLSPLKVKSASDAEKQSPRRNPEQTAVESPKKTPSKSLPKGTPGSQSPTKRSLGKSAKHNESPSRSPARVSLRTEEEQQAAAREKERQEMQAHKEARRKSLASRRVSFAPEATLHTWNVIEMPEDSTTSSASTNSTRRASGLTANHGSPYAEPSFIPSDGSEPPSTPPEQVEDIQVAQSPAHQRDMHQKKRRRSSTIPPMSFNEPQDGSSSPFSGDSEDDTTTQAFETADEGSDSSDSDDHDAIEDETVNNVDGDDSTFHSTNSTSSSGRLEAALQQAAKQAGTQGINYDEHGDLTMEMVEDEVTEAFQPFMKQSPSKKAIGEPSAFLDQENINPFSPAFKATLVKQAPDDTEDETMEMTQAIGTILPSEQASQSPQIRCRKSTARTSERRSSIARRRSSGDGSVFDGDQTMDMTAAIGGIQEPLQGEVAESTDGDEELTMEFTSVVGGVVQSGLKDAHKINTRRESLNSVNEDEDMDFTHAVGGILLPSITERTEPPEDQTMEMDVTAAVGSILPPQLDTNDKGEAKAIMEREADAGQLPTASEFHDGSPQKPRGAGLLDERPLPTQSRPPVASEIDSPGVTAAQAHDSVDTQAGPRQSLSTKPHEPSPLAKPAAPSVRGAGLFDERPLPTQSRKAMASETGSPSLTPEAQRSSKKAVGPRQSLIPKSHEPSPVKKPATPSKQLTPKPSRPLTPGKTPPPKNVAMRSASPKKLFEKEIGSTKKDAKQITPQPQKTTSLFNHDPVTGAVTPKVVLKPRKRRSSGFGIDREGLGSPRVSALLDRRVSIGESAKEFSSQGRAYSGVHFEDPRLLNQEIEQERAEDLRRESGLAILQDEVSAQDPDNERDATASLKGMIESLSPNKNKVKGRKSLHVGAAKGLLGKRPAELDDDDDQDVTPKKLKGREGSPVKKVKLPAPPSKAATTGRVTRSARLSLAETAGNAKSNTPCSLLTPSKNNTTPKDQARFKDIEPTGSAKVTSFESKVEGIKNAPNPAEEDERMHLQAFLQMTGIRFMDQLTTTKRRHTMATNAADQEGDDTIQGRAKTDDTNPANELEACVKAGACTIPMLELYQHSCRELKIYISEGRKVAKEIEQATFEDNPPLFREYLSAPADVRSIMDNQFKNVKTNARHLSKAMWYEWRMKLLEGLKEGLSTIGHGLEEDALRLTQQEQILQPVLPGLTEEYDKLEHQVKLAQAQADELAECDQEELKETRDQLVKVEDELTSKRQMVEELQTQFKEREDQLEVALTQKQECIKAIQEAEKIRQDCRGWSMSEVAALQAKVYSIEAEHGWTISSATGSALSMTYRRAIQLHFSPSALNPNASKERPLAGENAPISLTYIADANEHHPQILTTEKRFFLQIIRAHLQCLNQSQTKTKDLLGFVSSSWDLTTLIAEEARALGVGYLSEPVIKGDEIMAICSTIFLRAMQTKVEVTYELKVGSREGVSKLSLSVKPSVRVCYGETLNEKKMSEFVNSRMKGVEGYGVWAQATKELEEKLLSRGKKERK